MGERTKWPRTHGGRLVIPVMAVTLALTGCESVEDLVGLRGEIPDEAPTEASAAPPAPASTNTSGRSAVLLPQPSTQAASEPSSAPAASATPSPVQPAPLTPPPTTTPNLTPPPSATAVVPAPAPSPSDATGSEPTEEEALSFYQDVMLTYAFDACGLPLLGSISRQDISHRLDVCPAPPARKEALRLILQRAIANAERDPDKTRAAALAVCADKRAFLRNVMQHANQLTFDENAAPNCALITPPTTPPHP